MTHTLDSVIRSLTKKGVLFVDGRTRTLSLNTVERTKDDKPKIVQRKMNLSGSLVVVNNARDLGNGSWGKIDYLCGQHGYKIFGLNVLKQLNLLT